MQLIKMYLVYFLCYWKGVSALWLQTNICGTDEIEEVVETWNG